MVKLSSEYYLKKRTYIGRMMVEEPLVVSAVSDLGIKPCWASEISNAALHFILFLARLTWFWH